MAFTHSFCRALLLKGSTTHVAASGLKNVREKHSLGCDRLLSEENANSAAAGTASSPGGRRIGGPWLGACPVAKTHCA